MRFAGILLAAALAAAGCRLIERLSHAPVLPRNREPPPPGPPTYSHYLHEGWRWKDVGRVLVLPPRNESQFTRAGEELHKNLTAELQRLGMFEVVAAPLDTEGEFARLIHVSGRFDEGAILDLGKVTRADVIVFPTITHYSPYPRPRLGVVLQAVSPLDGKVIASVDGLWDTTDAAIAEQVRTFYRQRAKPLPMRVKNYELATDDAFAGERALDSPALFQRYICHVCSRILVGLPEAGGIPMQVDRPLILPRWKPGAVRQAVGSAPCVGCEPAAAGPGQPADPTPTGPAAKPSQTPGTPAAPPLPDIPPLPLPRKDRAEPPAGNPSE